MSPLSTAGTRRNLVLVGGGHTHVQVLTAFAMEPPRDTTLTVILDRPVAVYSGMVPGLVAGQYASHELEIDVVPLARRAGARVVLSPALAVDPVSKRIEIEGRPSVPYDLASFDIGSTVLGLELPGIREHAIPTRPIADLVARIEEGIEHLQSKRPGRPIRTVVVGGGAGGVELAFTLHHRLRTGAGLSVETRLVHAADELMTGYPEALRRRIHRQAEARGIEIVLRARVAGARAEEVVLEDGKTLAYDALLWVTGATSHALFGRSPGLELDSRGFVLTRPTLQVVGHDDLFAVGDCATLRDHPATAKAGVYAVRQGPFLVDNLRRTLDAFGSGHPATLRHYVPQRDFLTLLNLGDGTALGTKWSRAFGGRWVMRLKDRIDRRFMERFQVLDPIGELTAEYAARPAMSSDEAPMMCGGCAAKVGQSVLERALARVDARSPSPSDPSVVIGVGEGDDVSLHRSPSGELVASSIDLFRAFTDDPWLVGRVAAVNACSDLDAKGVASRRALAVVGIPEDLDDRESEETLYQVLAGARSVFDRRGVALVGGHTTTGPVLQVGFAVQGEVIADHRLLAIDGLEAGDALVLTEPLGTGVILWADMSGRCRGPWLASALEMMQRDNARAATLAIEHGAHAATDVTGFGLAGHLGSVVRHSAVAATLDLDRLPALPGALELLELGLRSTAHQENAKAKRGMRIPSSGSAGPRLELLFDPQTAGGLLIGIPADRAGRLIEALRESYPASTVIGTAECGDPVITVRGGTFEPPMLPSG